MREDSSNRGMSVEMMPLKPPLFYTKPKCMHPVPTYTHSPNAIRPPLWK
jgi:hypothetical protein